MNIQIKSGLPSAEMFQTLRSNVTWGPLSLVQARTALAGSLGGVIVSVDGQIIGMARFIGDGVLNIYIQDVIVLDSYRKTGIGKALIICLIEHLRTEYPKDCLIGLFAAEGQDSFYTQFGFKTRPDNGFGPGMHARLSDLAKSPIAA